MALCLKGNSNALKTLNFGCMFILYDDDDDDDDDEEKEEEEADKKGLVRII
jgi:hypothetical protein